MRKKRETGNRDGGRFQEARHIGKSAVTAEPYIGAACFFLLLHSEHAENLALPFQLVAHSE